MKKVSKLINCLLLSSILFINTGIKKADASFLPLPPMPWDIEFDPVAFVSKQISQGEAIIVWYKEIENGIAAVKERNIKGLAKFAKNGYKEYKNLKGKKKSPGKGEIQASSILGISEGSRNEKELFDAYHTLFFVYPPASSYPDASPQVINDAYKQKAIEYRQDTIMDAYLMGKITEDYLVEVEKAISRLDACVSGDLEGNDCLFFGMQVAKIESQEEAPSDDNSENPGQLGATMNSYIVTTVYDRLLQIVENLTAMEAQLRAAEQNDLVTPIPQEGGKQSNAEKFIENEIRFAYSDSQAYKNAKMLVGSYKRSVNCANGGPNCSDANTDSAELKNMDDSKIMGELQPIDDLIERARIIHNLKANLPEYKSQYRKYLQAKKNHERALNALKQSDDCVANFLNGHTTNGETGASLWYGGSKPSMVNDYVNRKGLSGELIKTYDTISADITIGTNVVCDGYYESCPSGYMLDLQNPCSENPNMFACIINAIPEDVSDMPEKAEVNNFGDETVQAKINQKKQRDTDGFADATNASKIDDTNRKKSELTWRIGYNKIMDLTKNGILKFKTWNDQEALQAEYLRLKYRNIGMIIKSTDEAINSYKIASFLASKEEITDDLAEKTIASAALCDTIGNAVSRARSEYCTGECDVTHSNGIITVQTYWRDEENVRHKGNTYTVNQRVSLNNTCRYTKGMGAFDASSICLTVDCIVKNYFPKVLGKDEGDEGLYNWAHSKGRIVAMDKLQEVIAKRREKDAEIEKLVKKWNDEIQLTKNKLNAKIASMQTLNAEIQAAKELKNTAEEKIREATQHIESIDDELASIKVRKKKMEEYSVNRPELEADIQSLTEKMAALEKEKTCLQTSMSQCGIYQGIPASKKEQEKQDSIIKRNEAMLEPYKEEIDALEQKVVSLMEEFAEEYIKLATLAQEEIEKLNREEFEDFVEPTDANEPPHRMLKGDSNSCTDTVYGLICKPNSMAKAKFASDNLATTVEKILYEKSLDAAVKQGINDTWFPNISNVVAMLSSAGVPESFVVDGTFSVIGLSGTVSRTDFATKLKDKVVDLAKDIIVKDIKQSDEIIDTEIKAAVKEVKNWTDELGVSGDDITPPKEFIYATESYLNGGKITKGHSDLITKLKTPESSILAEVNMDLKEIFGILDNISIDEEYFVGLPARGKTYRRKSSDDESAGHDYLSPKEPLGILPPVREVFYFNALDYQEVPSKNEKPAIPHLLNYKYMNEAGDAILDEQGNVVEYLPEIWRYLLARPNLRTDGKYQQTFVERSFGKAKLNDLVENRIANRQIPGAKPEHYRAIIGRGGVYPCTLAGVGTVDIAGGDSVDKIKFVKGSAPATTRCQEIISGDNTSNSCYLYNKSKKSGVCHLMADHGVNGVEDYQKSLASSNEPLYEKYSELGQFLSENMKYRPMQTKIHNFVKDKNNTENSINRQKALTATFNRNTFGSFLDMVTLEYNAHKNLNEAEDSTEDMLKGLCSQIHAFNQRVTVGNGEETDASCAKYIMDHGGLATSPLDEDYEVKCSSSSGNSFYSQFFCNLDSWKDSAVEEAQIKFTQLYNNKAEDIERVQERVDRIKDYISEEKLPTGAKRGSLVEDDQEIVAIQPGMNGHDVAIAAKDAIANRTVSRDAENEGIKSMDNQGQTVAYCPRY